MLKTIGIIFCLMAVFEMKTVCQTFIENEKVQKLIALKDKALFNFKEKDLTDIEFQLLDIRDNGIAINVSEKTNWEGNDTFPLLLISKSSGKHEWEFPLVEHSYLVGTNLFDGEVFVEKLFVNDREREPVIETYTVQDTSELPIASAFASIINLHDIPWLTPSNDQWKILIIYQNWISNSVNIKLEGDDIEEQIIPQSIIPPFNNDKPVPSYIKNNHTPAMPDEGLNFSFSYDQCDLAVSLTCSGSFNVVAHPYHFIFEKPELTKFKEKIIAVVPVTLLLISKSGKEFIQTNWHIPIYKSSGVSLPQKLQGYFTIDVLDTNKNIALWNNEYLAYMVIDGNVYGPKKFMVE